MKNIDAKISHQEIFEGDVLKIRINNGDYSENKPLFLRLKNSRHCLPRKKEEYPSFSLINSYFKAELRIPDHPLKTPNAGIYDIQIITKEKDNIQVLWTSPIIVNHFPQHYPVNYLDLIPKPQRSQFYGKSLSFGVSSALSFSLESDFPINKQLESFLHSAIKNRLKNSSEKSDILIRLEKFKQEHVLFHKEAYRLICGASEDGRVLINIEANQFTGLKHAIKTLGQLVKQENGEVYFPVVKIEDWPNTELRGIIEGFYGKPWSHQRRLDLIKYSSALKMNMFFYAPKDDPFHRQEWRTAYPEKEFSQLTSLINTCNNEDVHFVFSVSPGNSIEYSNSKDFELLYKKLKAIGDTGVRHFALLLDDIHEKLDSKKDKAQFKNRLGRAHAFLANQLSDRLTQEFGEILLIFCPTEYFQQEDSPYKKDIKKHLDISIPVIWTGQGVFSQTIDMENHAMIKKQFGHELFLWDNFPVNDGDFTTLFLGPLTNRGTNLTSVCKKMVANLMPESELSKLPLGTIADYFWNSTGYNPETSWENSLKLQVDDSIQDSYRMFAKHFFQSRIHSAKHELLNQNWHGWLNNQNSEIAFRSLNRFLQREIAAAKTLKKHTALFFKEDAGKLITEWLLEAQLCKNFLKIQYRGINIDKIQLKILKKHVSKLRPFESTISAGQFMKIIFYFMQKHHLPMEWIRKPF